MSDLTFTYEALHRSHDYARPQVEAGHRLHGGFLADDTYVPPRTLVRGPAIEAWTRALQARGGDLLPADSSLLSGIRYPSPAQQKLLLLEGLGQTFWNMLTITGTIEARGRLLLDIEFPEIQGAVFEDVSEMGVGHLNRGLLHAHGRDEGGSPEDGVGGHDVMWFALRDLAFGPTDYPAPEVPANIARPEAGTARIPELPEAIERTVDFLANLLLIEFRAERVFSLTETLLRDPELFVDRRDEAEHAAEIVDRIRRDEAIHVTSLRLYLGELESLTFATRDGGRLPGREVVSTLWNGVVHWATAEQPKLAAEQQRKLLSERIARHPEAARVQRAFDVLEETH